MSQQAINEIPDWKALDELPIVKKAYDTYYDPRYGNTRITMTVRFYRRYTMKECTEDFGEWQKEYPEISYDEEDKEYYFLDDPQYRRFSKAQAKLESRRRKAFVKKTSFHTWVKEFSEVGWEQYQMILEGKFLLQMRHIGQVSEFSPAVDDPNGVLGILPVDEQAKIIGYSIRRQIKSLRDAIAKEAFSLDADLLKRLLALPHLPYWIVMP
jgi:hypothetical protein